MTGGTEHGETFEHVSILRYNEKAAEHDRPVGEKVIVGGVERGRHVPDDDAEGFVKIADAVAIIELHGELTEGEVSSWCESNAGKLALAHWFEHIDPAEVVMT